MINMLLARRIVLILSAAILLNGSAYAEEPWDPIEPVNRGIFWFNDKFDYYIMEPVAQGYDDVMPGPVKESVTHFFKNLRYPQYLLSDLVQLKFGQAGTHTGRFLINSTLGLAGLFDVATEFGIEEQKEDFGIALAYHGVPSGPYLVIPFIGPSNLRDAVGLGVDTAVHPISMISYTNLSSNQKSAISLSLTGMRVVDLRYGLLDAVDAAKESSLDYYLFVQAAYYQHREGEIYDGKPPEDLEEEQYNREQDQRNADLDAAADKSNSN